MSNISFLCYHTENVLCVVLPSDTARSERQKRTLPKDQESKACNIPLGDYKNGKSRARARYLHNDFLKKELTSRGARGVTLKSNNFPFIHK
jgi:hypothetical protein